VVVGSAIVQRIAEGGTRAARARRVARFVRSLKQALRRGRGGARGDRPR
jgi:tryptophan synthase alpha chain